MAGIFFLGADPMIHGWSAVFIYIGILQSGYDITEGLSWVAALLPTASGASLNIALNFALIPRYGASGSAIATLISQSCSSFFFNLAHPRTRPIFVMQLEAFLLLPFIRSIVLGARKSGRRWDIPTIGGGIMNEKIYELGTKCFQRLGSAKLLGRPLDVFSKVWLRHRKLQSHLRIEKFDGVIDGGANIGEFAQIVRAVLPTAHLVCVEPHPDCARVLRQHGFKVIEAALWNQPGRLRLRQPTSATTSSTVLPGNSATKHEWEVEAVRLDSIDISGLRLLIKLDLQGAELKALDGMGDLWDRCNGLLLEVSLGPARTSRVIARNARASRILRVFNHE